ncbi:hypothetical protein AU512_09270 [Lonsdalea iberica]|uniref:Inner membrane protein n=1 Tax=Lonsdalea iberica TaxID=1082703 RepID=A0ABX3XFF4_9GAMM|nr:DUF1460 domain-containing protein [Lonsdalea iberica]OSN10268.1 hypothetical protein AU512_09270 [Lonsdalea iberica]
MKITATPAVPTPAYHTACASPNSFPYRIEMDDVTAGKVDQMIQSVVLPSAGERHGDVIGHLSSAFLDTPYQAETLIGGADTPEALVANFNGVDCFTLLDYVEALSRSHDQTSFLNRLVQTRYINNDVAYLSRRHFFSDWFATSSPNARDITAEISQESVLTEKQLNRKPNGEEYIPGLGITPRQINYIPGNVINQQVLDNLKTGDYVGVYTQLEGLDVTHVGVVIRHDGQVWFRNASSLSANQKVVDTPLMEYAHAKPGIIVLRAE